MFDELIVTSKVSIVFEEKNWARIKYDVDGEFYWTTSNNDKVTGERKKKEKKERQDKTFNNKC